MTTWSALVARLAQTELVERAEGAAQHLEAVARAGPVPALLTSNPTAFAYIAGGATCGRPIAPLGPRLTPRELAPCIAGLGSSVLLTEADFEPLAKELGVDVVVVDEPPRRPPRPVEVTEDDVAFVLHTSGTTGVPKSVAYLQGRMAIRTAVNSGLYGLRHDSVYATASPLHHIAGFGNHAVAMAAGATIAPLPRFTVETWQALHDVGVTHALVVPTMLELLLDAGALPLPTLQVLQYGASPIHPDTLRRVLATLPDVGLVNVYGQTEGSPITCLTQADHRRIAAEGRDDLLTSVGRAAPGVELRIDAPDDAGIGEVVARAAHLMQTDADGWLRTGDLGRVDGEGYLFLSGRRGDKIIRGGENVYPVEVEQVLEQHPAVREAAVVGVPDRRWGEIVRAVVVVDGPRPSEDELRAHARAQLAGFKVPTEWVFVDALPRNSAGKLLRRHLAENPLNR